MTIKTFTRKQHYLVVFVLLLITVFPRLPFQGPYLYNGDPVAYFSGAESILSNGHYLIDGMIPIWPIGTSLSLVPFIYFVQSLGGHPESAAFWHGTFFISLAVVFTYLLGKRLFNPATGIIGATLLSWSESPFIHSINSASDPGALAMLLGAVYIMQIFLDTQCPKNIFLSFFLLGLAIVFRWNYVFFLPFLLIYLVVNKRIWAFHQYPSFWILGFLGFLLGITPQLIINFRHFGNPFTIGYGQLDYSEQFVFSLVVYLKNLLRVAYRMLFTWDFYSPLLAMFGALAIVELWKERRRDIFWPFASWIVFGTLSVIYFGVKPRLLMPLMPPMYLIGANGIMRTFQALRTAVNLDKLSRRTVNIFFVIMALILFSPMFARTLLHAHGHFQDKVVMQKAFRWSGDNMPEGDAQIITQPFYAGHNADWLRMGWDVWASKRYSGRKIRSLQYPESWDGSRDWVVINKFWLDGSNLRVENATEISTRFDSLCNSGSLELKAEFTGKAEPLLLKKLNVLTYYPVDFLEYQSVFEIWGPKESK